MILLYEEEIKFDHSFFELMYEDYQFFTRDTD